MEDLEGAEGSDNSILNELSMKFAENANGGFFTMRELGWEARVMELGQFINTKQEVAEDSGIWATKFGGGRDILVLFRSELVACTNTEVFKRLCSDTVESFLIDLDCDFYYISYSGVLETGEIYHFCLIDPITK